MTPKFNAIILARGGSKSIPSKNLQLVASRPLLAWPILAARKSAYIDKVYVSTDDEIISQTAQEFGAAVIQRPHSLAEDTSLDIDALRHAVSTLESNADLIQLRATTPMVETKLLNKAIKLFSSNPNCTSLRSAHESSETAYKYFKQEGDYWSGLFDDQLDGEYYNWPRQQLPRTYCPNGYIDIVRPSHFMGAESLHGNKILSFITSFAHEIDTPHDLRVLRALYDKDKT
jgi:CMP-N,N'-diacetyllegionaminic acid synthase